MPTEDTEETAQADEETPDNTWLKGYEQGIQAGRKEAFTEAVVLVRNAAATEYIAGGSTREAQRLRELCLSLMEKLHA